MLFIEVVEHASYRSVLVEEEQAIGIVSLNHKKLGKIANLTRLFTLLCAALFAVIVKEAMLCFFTLAGFNSAAKQAKINHGFRSFASVIYGIDVNSFDVIASLIFVYVLNRNKRFYAVLDKGYGS